MRRSGLVAGNQANGPGTLPLARQHLRLELKDIWSGSFRLLTCTRWKLDGRVPWEKLYTTLFSSLKKKIIRLARTLHGQLPNMHASQGKHSSSNHPPHRVSRPCSVIRLLCSSSPATSHGGPRVARPDRRGPNLAGLGVACMSLGCA